MRRIATLHAVIIAAMLGLLAAGCASSSADHSGSTKAYTEPKLAPEQTAIVKSGRGVKVVTVDGAPVTGANIQMANFGGNSVRLTPGNHRIVARRAVSGTPITYNDVTYDQTFQAGHTYSVGPDSEFGSGVKLEDVTRH